jgi:hypothetical protein
MPKHFAADLARYDNLFRSADAIRTEADGFAWIDTTKVPAAAVRSYNLLMQHGYANGWI